jgi:hypothetical protein
MRAKGDSGTPVYFLPENVKLFCVKHTTWIYEFPEKPELGIGGKTRPDRVIPSRDFDTSLEVVQISFQLRGATGK